MKIKKLLIVPVDTVVEPEPKARSAAFLLRGMKFIKRKIFRGLSVYESEIIRYADIPKILGSDNVFIFGKVYPHLHSMDIPRYCPYPSCHGTPRYSAVDEKGLRSAVRQADAILVSVKSAKSGRALPAMRLARERDIPIAMIDTHDHEEIFMTSDIKKELFYGFQQGKDFDVFFKTSLPLGFRTDRVLPIAPVPIRPETHHFRAIPKIYDVFYSGRKRTIAQPDRDETVSALRADFPNSKFYEHTRRKRRSFIPVRDYWDGISRSRFALSPSGRVWDSFRHCEAGLAPKTALIAPKPYEETTGPALRDGVNSVLYETEFRGGRTHLKDPGVLIEKVRYYLEHPAERERLADRWAADVLSGHTVYARSKYIVESIEKLF